jgi:hypothetical protein
VETVYLQELTQNGSHEGGQKMIDYSQYLLMINRLMQEVHKAAQSNNYEAASNLAAEVARCAISLAAILESRTETEV